MSTKKEPLSIKIRESNLRKTLQISTLFKNNSNLKNDDKIFENKQEFPDLHKVDIKHLK